MSGLIAIKSCAIVAAMDRRALDRPEGAVRRLAAAHRWPARRRQEDVGRELAAALSLTPGTVVHHLKRLREAGLVESQARPPYMDYSLRIGRLGRDRPGAAPTRHASRPANRRSRCGGRSGPRAEEARTLRAFFDGDRLLSIPAQHSKRLTVLRQLAETVFERKRKYPEKEVNQLLAVRHPDAASLRRYLVDEGFMARKNSVYRLRPRRDWPQRPGRDGADGSRSAFARKRQAPTPRTLPAS